MVAIALIILGYVAVGAGLFAKKFYSADVEGGGFEGERPVSTWSGRVVFIAVGLGLILTGFVGLFRGLTPE